MVFQIRATTNIEKLRTVFLREHKTQKIVSENKHNAIVTILYFIAMYLRISQPLYKAIIANDIMVDSDAAYKPKCRIKTTFIMAFNRAPTIAEIPTCRVCCIAT